MVRTGNVAASRGSSPRLEARRGPATLLLFAALASATAVAQPTPQPIFTELFAYDPAAPSQLLGKWRISSQLDNNLQALRFAVVEDPIGKTVGRVTVQEGDGLDGASEAMLQARRYVCNDKGSRAAAIEAEPGAIVPSERAEIQVRSDRATGAGELVKFGQPVWYRFSFKIPSDWPRDVPAAGRQLCRTVIHQIKQDSFNGRKSCDASPFFKIEARPLGERVRFFAQVASGAPCAQPPMVTRTQICRRDLPLESWTTVQVRLNPAHVLRRLPGTHGRSGPWRPPQRRALRQRTTALRHLPRLALADPDDLFRQNHVLEHGPGSTPGLEGEAAAEMTADGAPTSVGAIRDFAGGFRAVLGVCVALQVVAGAMQRR
jgi:hypothetical protein